MKNYSLFRRLTAWIGTPLAVALALVILASYYFSYHEIEEVYDAQMVHSAKVLLQLTQHEITTNEGFRLGLENQDLQHRYERKLNFRIWTDKNLITASSNTDAFKDFEAPPGFSNQTLNGHEWRFFVFLDPASKIKIEISERYDIRYELIFQLMTSLLVPALIFLPIILLVTWAGVRQALKPVVTISDEVDSRGSHDFMPIHTDTLPKEIMPLAHALNRLFHRQEDSFRREREFTDHAAHELRTPLAAMKTQTQVLLKKAKSMPECVESLENLQSSIDRATHLIEQILLLSRLQHEDLPRAEIDLSSVLDDCIAVTRSHAAEKNINLSVEIQDKCLINAHVDAVSILLRNLLDNAFKYTPANGSVFVKLQKDGLLTIADTGPGLSDADKARVFGRFVRVDKTGQIGSGLGLSIAQWIADAHGVAIKLHDNHPKGLIVSLQWIVND